MYFVKWGFHTATAYSRCGLLDLVKFQESFEVQKPEWPNNPHDVVGFVYIPNMFWEFEFVAYDRTKVPVIVIMF